MVKKVFASAAEVMGELKGKGTVRDGITVMVGGFGLCGIPEHLITALRESGVKGLTCVSNNAGVDDFGLGLLLQTRQIAKMISSYVGENGTFEKQFLDGSLEVEFNPQGTLAERIRAGGAGIPAFYTATGVGTPVAAGKEIREFYRPGDDTRNHNRTPSATSGTYPEVAGRLTPRAADAPRRREYVLETGLYADLTLVKAHLGDEFGNLVYRKTARNFNPMMATAAAFVIAEVEQIVPVEASTSLFVAAARLGGFFEEWEVATTTVGASTKLHGPLGGAGFCVVAKCGTSANAERVALAPLVDPTRVRILFGSGARILGSLTPKEAVTDPHTFDCVEFGPPAWRRAGIVVAKVDPSDGSLTWLPKPDFFVSVVSLTPHAAPLYQQDARALGACPRAIARVGAAPFRPASSGRSLATQPGHLRWRWPLYYPVYWRRERS